MTTRKPQPTRLEELVADLSVRLRKACADMPDADFSRLVQDVATTKLRCEMKHEQTDDPQGVLIGRKQAR